MNSKRWQLAFLGAAALAVFVFAVLAARWRPLWYDELFTLYVAGEPSLASTIRALLAGADTNPPLDYVLRHASLALLGSSPEAFRWPSAAAFLAGLFAIYAYVRRNASFLAAAGAFLLPIGTAAVYFSHEGRAYALLFASAPVALWTWQRAVERPRTLSRLILLLGALCLGPFSHYYGVMNFLPVAAGEAWRSYRRRALDWPIITTVAAACVLTLGLLPFARTATAMKEHFWASGFQLADVLEHYRGWLAHGGMTLPAVLAAIVLLAAFGAWRVPRASRPGIPSHEVVAAFVLAMTPFSELLLAEFVTGALTSKYSIALVPGVAILAGYLLFLAEAALPMVVGLIVAVLAGSGLWLHASTALAYRGIEPVDPKVVQVLQKSSLPVAFHSPHQFLEVLHYAPQLAATGRLYYPMDPATAREVRGFDNDEIALRRLAQIRPMHLAGYREFTDRHGRFLVVHSRAFWPSLLEALQRDGYCLAEVESSGTTSVLLAFPGCEPARD